MKNPKFKPKPAKKLEAKSPAMDSTGLDAILTEFHESGLPTPEQIAIIAATLACDRGKQDFLPTVLTAKAMKLWLRARETIVWTVIENEIGKQERIFQNLKDDRYRFFAPTDKYPVTRKELLQRVLPENYKNRKAELDRIGKEYWRGKLIEENRLNGTDKAPSASEVNEAYGRWGPFQDFLTASIIALHFSIWHDHQNSIAHSFAGKKSADKKAKNAKEFAEESKTSRRPA